MSELPSIPLVETCAPERKADGFQIKWLFIILSIDLCLEGDGVAAQPGCKVRKVALSNPFLGSVVARFSQFTIPLF